jgi:hypothetical protein
VAGEVSGALTTLRLIFWLFVLLTSGTQVWGGQGAHRGIREGSLGVIEIKSSHQIMCLSTISSWRLFQGPRSREKQHGRDRTAGTRGSFQSSPSPDVLSIGRILELEIEEAHAKNSL